MNSLSKAVEVVYFCEDLAHENFLRGLIWRVAGETGFQSLKLFPGSVKGGSQVWKALTTYLRRFDAKSYTPSPDLLLVLIDSDCEAQATQTRLREITEGIRQRGTPQVVAGIPIPHVEAWYLCDPEAVWKALGEGVPPEFMQKKRPAWKELFRLRKADCQIDYKDRLRDFLSSLGIQPISGGAEYGESLARNIDPKRMPRDLKEFWEALRNALRACEAFG